MSLKINLILNYKNFQKMIESFCESHGTQVTVIDENGELVTKAGKENYVLQLLMPQDFSNSRNDIKHETDVVKMEKQFGLYELVIPVIIEDEYSGAIILGPVFSQPVVPEFVTKAISDSKTDRQKFLQDVNKIPVLGEEEFYKISGFVIYFKDYIIERAIEKNKKAEIENQLKKAQEIAHLGNWEINLLTREARWSDEFRKIFGLEDAVAVLSQQDLLESAHPEDRQILFDIYNRSREKYDAQDCIYRIIRRNDNEIRYVYHKWEFERDQAGNPIKMIGVIQDITNLKKADLAKKESEERFKQVTENAEVWVWEVNQEGLYTYSSSIVEKILGYTAEEIVGHKYVYDFFAPGDKVEQRHKALEIVKSYKPFINFPKVAIHKNGSKVILESSGSPYFSESGKLLGYRGTDLDITKRTSAELELKESEKRFRAVYENAGTGIFIADKEGRIIKGNNTLVQMLGFSNDEIIGKTTKDFTLRDDIVIGKNMYSEIVTGRREHFQVEKRYLTKEEKIIWVQLTVTAIRDDLGKFIVAVGIVENITERKSSIEEINKMNKELKELNATKDKFFSIIAHDLKSPFQGMLGLSELLLDQNLFLTADERNKRLLVLQSLLKNQYELLHNLLSWAQMQLGKVTFNPKSIQINPILEKIMLSLTVNTEKKNIIIQNEIEDNVTAFADENMLLSIFQNIISNSIKFTNNNGIIRVYSATENFYRKFYVEDNGIGMSEETIQKIFDLNYHFTTKGTNGEIGTGLGVMLCKEMIEMHSGKIEIFSEINKGTTISFSIPFDSFI